MPILEVRDVCKAFAIPGIRRDTLRDHVLARFRRRRFERLQVLDSVSFQVEKGEALGIMGRNGCGKSTLLRIVSGIYPPDRGSIVRRGAITPILELGVGWNPELDAIDNVHLLGSVMGLTLAEIRQATDDILAFAGLERFANLRLKHYSTGMASRLAYAVAFQAVREVLLLDEILAVGDASFKERCFARYRELQDRGVTVLLVSHEPKIVSTFCDRAILLEGGRILMDSRPDRVAESYLRLLG